MAFSMAGHADLATLNSRMSLYRVLLHPLYLLVHKDALITRRGVLGSPRPFSALLLSSLPSVTVGAGLLVHKDTFTA